MSNAETEHYLITHTQADAVFETFGNCFPMGDALCASVFLLSFCFTSLYLTKFLAARARPFVFEKKKSAPEPSKFWRRKTRPLDDAAEAITAVIVACRRRSACSRLLSKMRWSPKLCGTLIIKSPAQSVIKVGRLMTRPASPKYTLLERTKKTLIVRELFMPGLHERTRFHRTTRCRCVNALSHALRRDLAFRGFSNTERALYARPMK